MSYCGLHYVTLCCVASLGFGVCSGGGRDDSARGRDHQVRASREAVELARGGCKCDNVAT
jgi:hypothetical protein